MIIQKSSRRDNIQLAFLLLSLIPFLDSKELPYDGRRYHDTSFNSCKNVSQFTSTGNMIKIYKKSGPQLLGDPGLHALMVQNAVFGHFSCRPPPLK